MNLDSDVTDLNLSEEVKKDNQSTMGPGLSNDASQEEIHPPTTNDDSENKEEHMNLPQPLRSRSVWKHISSHPLENLISPLNSTIQTKLKTRNFVAL